MLVTRQLRRQRIVAVYGSGMLQGISLVLLPAAGPIVTSPAFHGLSSGQFGVLFLPLVAGAILASAGSARLTARFGSKRSLRLGLAADLAGMTAFAASGILPLPLLLVAATAVGGGFGLAVSTLNTFAFELFPGRGDSAVTGLHVATGLGQVLAPLSLALLAGLGAWWLAPTFLAVALAGMVRFQRCLPLRLDGEGEAGMISVMPRLPSSVWLWVAVVVMYGAVESVFGNWSAIFLGQDAGLTAARAAAGLAAFWAAVTAGRLLFAVAALHLRTEALYVLGPAVAAGALIALPGSRGFAGAVITLAAGGLGLSFLFPYSVSLATARFPASASAVSGILVAALMLGAGVSAQAVGLLRDAVGLGPIFRIAAVAAFAMVVLAAVLIRPARSAATT